MDVIKFKKGDMVRSDGSGSIRTIIVNEIIKDGKNDRDIFTGKCVYETKTQFVSAIGLGVWDYCSNVIDKLPSGDLNGKDT
jgi:hypothetical protein